MIPFGLNPLGVDIATEETDLDVLRSIRDANPDSQLPALWLDSEDPYTDWWRADYELGVLFGGDTRLDQYALNYNISIPPIGDRDPYKAYAISIPNCNVNSLTNISGITFLHILSCENNLLTTLDVQGLETLKILNCYSNQILSLDISSLIELQHIDCSTNRLNSFTVSSLPNFQYLDCSTNHLVTIPSLVSVGNITTYYFTYNNLSTSELDRFRALGFTDESKLLPQNP